MGPFIPDFLHAEKNTDEAKDVDYTTFILADAQSAITADSTVRAVEGYGIMSGDLELQIFRPFCGNVSCPEMTPIPSCPGSQLYCAKIKSCLNATEMRAEFGSLCRVPPTGPQFAQYKLVRRVKVTILRGYFFIRLSKSRALKAGDLLGLKTRGGVFAHKHIEAGSGEMPDWKLNDGNPEDPLKFVNSGQMVPLNGIKYMVKVLFYEDRIINPMHDYENSSEYQITMNAMSPWGDASVTHTKTINVVMSINKLRARVVPPNVAIGQKVDVSIILSSGTLVKLFW